MADQSKYSFFRRVFNFKRFHWTNRHAFIRGTFSSNETLHALLIELLFWIPALAISLITAWKIATNSEEALIWGGTVILTILMARHESFAIYLFLLMPTAGELARQSIGPENGLLPTDILIPLFICVWLAKKFLIRPITQPYNSPESSIFSQAKSPLQRKKNNPLKPLLFFGFFAILSLIQAFAFLKPAEVLTSSFYLIRFISYALLYLVVSEFLLEDASQKQTRRLFNIAIAAGVIITVAGFIQLMIYPDLGNLETYGWDPHINRLVSTWLDPNFVGGYLAFIICVILGVATYASKASHKIYFYAVVTLMSVALFLTYSRSAYLAAAAGITIYGILKSRRLLIVFLIIFLLAIGLSPRAEQRVTDLKYSISAFIFNTSSTPDPTAKLRIQSWEQTLELIAKRPLLGSGFNTLRYVKYNEGYISNTKIHSASGSDSSLLTVLATTGIAGFMPFIWFYFEIAALTFKNWRNKKIPAFGRGISLGLFAGLAALFCHSFFVNSLFFPPILIPVTVIIGIVDSFSRRQIR